MIYLYAIFNEIDKKNIANIKKLKGIFQKNISILSKNKMMFLYSTIKTNIENMTIDNILEHHTLIENCVKNDNISTLLPFKIPTIFENIDDLKNWSNEKKIHLQKQIKLFENKVEYTLLIDVEWLKNNPIFRTNINIKDEKIKSFLEKKTNEPFYQIDKLVRIFLKEIEQKISIEHLIIDKKCVFLINKKDSFLFEDAIQQYLQTFNTNHIFQLSGFWAVHHFSKIYYE